MTGSYLAEHSECAASCDEPEDVIECTGDDMIRARLACDRIFEERGKFKVRAVERK